MANFSLEVMSRGLFADVAPEMQQLGMTLGDGCLFGSFSGGAIAILCQEDMDEDGGGIIVPGVSDPTLSPDWLFSFDRRRRGAI